jgi:hypothetical protein
MTTEYFPQYLARLVKPQCMVFRLHCENHTRQQQRLKRILPDWSVLQQESSYLDQEAASRLESGQTGPAVDFKSPTAPYRHPFFVWVFDQTLQLLSHHLLLGCELELFVPRELPVVYWYLTFLFQLMTQNRIQSHREVTRTKKKKKVTLVYRPVMPPLTSDACITEAYMRMCRGITHTVKAVERLGFQVPQLGSDAKFRQNWFTNRFSAMAMVHQPRPLTLQQYEQHEEVLNKHSAAELLTLGREAFSHARNMLTKAMGFLQPQGRSKKTHEQSLPNFEAEMLALKRVAVTNSILFASVTKLKANAAQYMLKYDFTLHKQFPTLSLVPIPAPTEAANKENNNDKKN